MTDNVVKFYPADAAKLADNVLELAKGDFETVLLIGWNKDGMFEARATLDLVGAGETLFLVETFKHKLMSGDYADEDE